MPICEGFGDCRPHPDLRSVNASRAYIEPNYTASNCDAQLPMISSIGKGQRGNGIIVQVNSDDAGDFRFTFLDERTGEAVLQSPNLGAPDVSVVPVVHEPTAGETVPVIFRVTKGKDVSDYTVLVPAGSTGSLIYLYDEVIETSMDGTYKLSVDDLTIYGRSAYPSKPTPRQNDIVFFRYKQGLAFGTIEAVENGSVVFTCRTMIPWPVISVSADGDVTIDGKATGVNIKGPKGATGATGDDGKPASMVIGNVFSSDKPYAYVYLSNAAKNEYTLDLGLQRGQRGYKGDTGEDGEDGEDGKPATMVIGDVSETSQPIANVRMTDVKNNVFTLDLGLPRGADGKSVNINGGIYKIADLPAFDDTPVNDAFIVDDEDGRYDLYIRGISPVIASEGGPWTVVEDWQGIQGYSMRRLKSPYRLADEPLEFSKDDVDSYLAPSKDILDGDLVIDDDLCLGVVSSAFDQSGTYVITRTSSEVASFMAKIQKEMADYEAKMNQEMAEHKAEVDKEIAEHKADIEQYETDLTQKFNTFKTGLNQEMTDYKAEVDKEISDHETAVQEDLDAQDQDILEFKTYVTNLLEQTGLNLFAIVDGKVCAVYDDGKE